MQELQVVGIEYRWLWQACSSDALPAILYSISLIIAVKVVFSFLIWRRKQRSEEEAQQNKTSI